MTDNTLEPFINQWKTPILNPPLIPGILKIDQYGHVRITFPKMEGEIRLPAGSYEFNLIIGARGYIELVILDTNVLPVSEIRIYTMSGNVEII